MELKDLGNSENILLLNIKKLCVCGLLTPNLYFRIHQVASWYNGNGLLNMVFRLLQWELVSHGLPCSASLEMSKVLKTGSR